MNNDEDSDEARYVDVPCTLFVYNIGQQRVTTYQVLLKVFPLLYLTLTYSVYWQDYHTAAIDNHHLLPICINTEVKICTGSLAVIHSNQFIKFYYYGDGCAGVIYLLFTNLRLAKLIHSLTEIQGHYHVHSLNNYISEKKLFIPPHSNNWYSATQSMNQAIYLFTLNHL